MIAFYNDLDGMKRLYENLHGLGIYSIWADGRFQGFKRINGSNASTDGSREFIESKPDTHLFTVGPYHQYVKTSWLFRFSGDYKYSLSMGCDEYLEGDLDLLYENLKKHDKLNVLDMVYFA